MSEHIRVATFNASLNRAAEGELIADLGTPDDAQARKVAQVIQAADADVILVNEFDYDAGGAAAALFAANYLGVGQDGEAAIDYPYVYVAPSNTGVPSGFDLNNDGAIGGPDDAFGFGAFEGQFGFVVYSKHPIDAAGVRSFQNFLWKDMPGGLLPEDPEDADGDGETAAWFTPEELAVVRLSSKTHVDVPVQIDGEVVHILAAHPTPPVFDGAEDRNGRRNFDEIRFWNDYVDGADYIYDDQGATGGLAPGARFVIAGDYNADPFDGDSVPGSIAQLLDDPAIIGSATDAAITPASEGGPEQAELQGGVNAGHVGDPAFDTADFPEPPGNLRVDYVLPSAEGFAYLDGAVFWPESADPDFDLTGVFPFPTSDHRLVYADLRITDQDRATVAPLNVRPELEADDFLGAVELPSGLVFEETIVGGLSGLVYDAVRGTYLAVSDDRGDDGAPRFYEIGIDLGDGALDAGDVSVLDVTALTVGGATAEGLAPDLEGIALGAGGQIYVASERDVLGAPAIYRVGADGALAGGLPIDAKFQPTPDGASGVRDNLGFESLTVTPDQRHLYAATESALRQDGDPASLAAGAAARILRYDLATGLPVAEYVYEVDPIAAAPDPADAFADSGLVELIAVDNQGTLLALERSFSTVADPSLEDRGYTGKLYLVRTQGATNVIGEDSLPVGLDDEGALEINVDAVVQKELLLDLSDIGVEIDNVEGMALGPKLADGRRSLVIVSDDNFSGFGPQASQFIALALDVGSVPTLTPTLETPDDLRYKNEFDTVQGADPDDPAVWRHPDDAGRSLVITAMKEGGLRVFDLAGALLQRIEPEGVRYNNVDILYGVELGGRTRDIAIASDRANDTLAVFRIRADGTLRDITAEAVPDSIFGVDDGEATAYGLAAYASVEDGKPYVFVTQASGAKIAQLELVDRGGRVGFEKVRELTLPLEDGDDPEDFQSEGITVDRQTGVGYVTVEGELGLLSFDAEVDGADGFEVVAPIDSDFLAPDLEGVAIHYGQGGAGLILVSSQGDSTFAVFDRATEDYLGSFAIRGEGGVDGVEESDGLEVYSGALPGFEDGLLVTQDGSNEVQVVFGDPEDGEVQNFNVNFKYSGLGDVLELFGAAANPGFDPRDLPALARGLEIETFATFQGESDPANEDSPELASEVVAYENGQLYVTNGNLDRIDIFRLTAEGAGARPPKSIDLTGVPGFAGVQSVAVANGLIAAAIAIEDVEVALPPALGGGSTTLGSNGVIAFFDAKTRALVETVEVGNLPDQLVFTADGETLLVANEGSLNEETTIDQNPAGSVSIIDVGDFTARTVGFEALTGLEDAARAAGVRVSPGQPLELDLEPEYIAIAPDQTTAYVTLQENNTVAVIDIATATLTDLLPLDVVDHGLPANAIDPLDDGVVDIRSFDDLVGLRMPDAVTAFDIGGARYFATANEGDARGEAPDFDEARVEDLPPGAIDPSVDTAGLERLAISTVDGDTDGDGDIDVLHAFGARSFTIFDADGGVVFESGSELTRLAAQVAPERYQDDEGEPDENRADAKGVEPEAIEVAEIDGEVFAFVGLERDSGIAVYNITDPAAATLIDYIDGFAAGNRGPEILEFVAAEDSPGGIALLLASYEISGTTVAYSLESGGRTGDLLLDA